MHRLIRFATCILTLLSSTLHALPDISSLSLEEKAGQLLIVHFNGTEANEASRKLISNEHVGGFILYNWSNGLTSPGQVRKLTEGMQLQARTTPHSIPLIISTDQEGGAISRLRNGFTHFPDNYTLAKIGSCHLTYECAKAMAAEQLSVGINLALAPVVDIGTDASGSFIGARSFGQHPQTVITFGKEVLNGYRAKGLLSTLKHYPGIGNVEIDPHLACPVNESSLTELHQKNLAPFKALAPFADVIMTGHVIYKAIDPDRCATLSPKAIQLLRKEIEFDGVVITDSMVMNAVTAASPSIEETCIQALEAGCDLLLLGGKQLNTADETGEIDLAGVRNIRLAIVQAVQNERVPVSRLDEAVRRVLKLKESIAQGWTILPLEEIVRTPFHLDLAEKVFE